MPGSTPLYALPYPLAGDTISSLDETFRALTTRLEIVLAAASQPPLTPSDFSAITASIAAFNAAPVVVASPFAAASGWAVAGTLWAWQRVRFCSIAVTNNTGAAITTTSAGMISPAPTCATIAAGHRPAAIVTTWAQGVFIAGRINTTGTVQLLLNVPTTGSLANGSVVTLPFVYVV